MICLIPLPPPHERDKSRFVWPTKKDGRIWTWALNPESFMNNLNKGYIKLIESKSKEQKWQIKYLKKGIIQDIDNENLQITGYGHDGAVKLSYRHNYEPTTMPPTVWHRSSHKASKHGTELLSKFLGERNRFNYPKSLYAVVDTLSTVTRNNRQALILDFYAGSGTTLHATALLNAIDGGHRQSIVITNNEVSPEVAIELSAKEIYKGDPRYEQEGIFRSVTMPRLEAAITGSNQKMEIAGKYRPDYIPNHQYCDGFQENVAFYTLDYLDNDLIEIGRSFNQISPLLWMRAGSKGSPVYWDGELPYLIADSSYGVLFDESHINEFSKEVESSNIIHVWIVSNSYSVFMQAKQILPKHIQTYQLYEEYLCHFRSNS